MFITVGGELVIRDFLFNAWGNKYGTGELDNQVPAKLAHKLNIPRAAVAMVLEGGAIESDGKGTGMTTASCLFNDSRNPGLDRQIIIDTVKAALGFERLLVLPGGDIEGDDTDGHIDNLVRFLSPDILAVSKATVKNPAYAVTEANWDAAAKLQTRTGRPYQRVPLPVPDPIPFQYPGDRFTPPRKALLPASYANFVMANGSVFVPTFGQDNDDIACRRIDEATGKGWRVVPIPSEWLIVGQGGLHCLTQHQPTAG